MQHEEALGYINPPPPYGSIMNSQVWRQMHVNGAQIEFRDEGSGQAVVFVHGAMGEECTAVLADPVWTTGYRVIHYHRRGYGNSTRPEAHVTTAQQCNDCLALLRHMGVQRAHFVGQSYGAVIILQIIKDAPEVVHTAALLEPALPSVMADFPEFTSAVGRALSLYQSGDKRAAMDVFAGAVVGPDVPAEVDRSFREKYFEVWVRDADTVCQSDLPALGEWNFTADDARSVKQPVLNVMGAHTPPFFREVHSRLQSWLPDAENVVVPGVSHPLLQMDPRGMAQRLASFCRKHPLDATVAFFSQLLVILILF
jgi:pimeloyl-ACP methyl ester carboxylesterase